MTTRMGKLSPNKTRSNITWAHRVKDRNQRTKDTFIKIFIYHSIWLILFKDENKQALFNQKRDNDIGSLLELLSYFSSTIIMYYLNCTAMQAIKFEEHLNRCLRRFIKKEGRINFELRELNELMKTYRLAKPLSQLLRDILPTPVAFKILILINRLIIEECLEEGQVLELLSQLRVNSEQEFQQLLNVKLILPFKLYLQRRACIHLGMVKYTNRRQAETRVFQLLNLINTGTAFSDVIYTFGRYYLQKYNYAIDFNIVLGADLQLVYADMVDQVLRPAHRTILEEIQMVHEKMYVVFYNCYFHKYLRNYLPKWVITDVRSSSRDTKQTARTNTDTKVSRHASMEKSSSAAASKKGINLSSTNLGDSMMLLNERVEEQVQSDQFDHEPHQNPETPPPLQQEQRLKLLLSMQRVVAELTD